MMMLDKLTKSKDLHAGNVAFALPNLDALSVEELYEHIGQPRTVPFYQDETWGMFEEDEVPASFSPHQPRYRVAPPSPKKLWRLCCGGKFPDSSLPSIRILDFTESFRIPLPATQEIPGTPLVYASPELLLVQGGLLGREHITTGIDIWAFACMMYRLLGTCNLFATIFGTSGDMLADIISFFGGKAKAPEEIWRIFWEELHGSKWFEEDGKPTRMAQGCRHWEQRIIPRVRTEDRDVFLREDEPVVRKILTAALKWDKNERASMLDIVGMIPESWEKEVHIATDDVYSSDDGYPSDGYSSEEEEDGDCVALDVEEDADREHYIAV
jgi:serine/threonine protein kinase